MSLLHAYQPAARESGLLSTRGVSLHDFGSDVGGFCSAFVMVKLGVTWAPRMNILVIVFNVVVVVLVGRETSQSRTG